MDETGLVFITGRGLIVTVTLFVLEQPFPSVTVTVYVTVDDGPAITVDPVDPDNPVEGDHA